MQVCQPAWQLFLLSASVVTGVCLFRAEQLNSITAQHIQLSHWMLVLVLSADIEVLSQKLSICFSKLWLLLQSPAVWHIGYLCLAARPLFYWGASPARTPGVNHLPAWHEMPRWRWQRTYSQSEKMRCSFKDFPEALGLYTGKKENTWSTLFLMTFNTVTLQTH